jgi:hypothetical protein
MQISKFRKPSADIFNRPLTSVRGDAQGVAGSVEAEKKVKRKMEKVRKPSAEI